MKKISTIFLMLFVACSVAQAQNYSFLLDGNSEFIQLPQDDNLNVGPDGFTIEAWIYANEWKGQQWQGSLVNSDAPSPDRGYGFRCGAGGKLSFVMSVDGAWTEVVTSAVMNAKQWHHVAAVKNTEALILYIDGLESARLPFSGDAPIAGVPVKIGASGGFGDRFFDGAIDEIRIWNVARTQQELSDNKTIDFTGNETGLVTYLPFNEGSGTTIGNLAAPATAGTAVDTDDSNWVGGYTLPDFDVSIVEVSGIDKWDMKRRPVRLTATIQNVGTMPISAVEVNLTVGTKNITEVIDQVIDAGGQLNYVFTTPVDLSQIDNPEINVTISHPDDANELNNEVSIVVSTREGDVVNLFDASLHNFGGAGQTQSQKVLLPADLSDFAKILMHISVDCPSSGCDPWDQTGKVVANTSSGSFEIARYITPYGIGCGPWTVDVTDFKSVLAGEVNYDSFIQVFGPSGWLVTIDLELIEEDGDALPFHKVTPLWQDDYIVYGDPGISHDLDPVNVAVADQTESSHVRVHLTGHGQGNTSNAAEFFQTNHSFVIDGLPAEIHTLWKSDCAANSCDDQLGTWLSSRAGWCPGQEVTPRLFNTTDMVSAGGMFEMDYEFQDYTNLLNTGYNSSGHTEPHYRMHGVFVERSSERFGDYNNMMVRNTNYNTANGDLSEVTVTVRNEGTNTVESFDVRYFQNDVLKATENVSVTLASGEEYVHTFEGVDGFVQGIDNVFFGEVLAIGDENRGDNISSTTISADALYTFDASILNEFTIQPNPAQGNINVRLSESLVGGQLELFTIDGRKVDAININGNNSVFDAVNAGTYLVKVIDPNGYTATRKVIVID